MAELPQSEILLLITIGSLGMLSLAGGMAFFIAIYQKRMLQAQENQRQMEKDYQEKMIQRGIESQETESMRIAADLHDSIGSTLWAIKLNVGFMGRSLPLTGELKTSYNETMRMLDQSIDSVKRIAWELTPEALHHSGLSSSIHELCRRLDGKPQAMIWEETGEPMFWCDDRALMVFRIVQELVNNAVKHSGADTIQVHSAWGPSTLVIVVRDNGRGFTLQDTQRKGVGWWNITHRVMRLHANVKHLETVIGTAIELRIPLQP